MLSNFHSSEALYMFFPEPVTPFPPLLPVPLNNLSEPLVAPFTYVILLSFNLPYKPEDIPRYMYQTHPHPAFPSSGCIKLLSLLP